MPDFNTIKREKYNFKHSKDLNDKDILNNFRTNLDCIDIVYSISKLKQQVFYLLQKDQEYMSKMKQKDDVFFSHKVWFKKDENTLSINKVFPNKGEEATDYQNYFYMNPKPSNPLNIEDGRIERYRRYQENPSLYGPVISDLAHHSRIPDI
mmetsp:Transcript_15193/g.13319  ORF Transcript_15193/g.13319 Transcript_15193/m.13319 type:complete len:151 (+) Transcript_15193:549-1001(+)